MQADVVIVGAGAAGVAAGLELQARGVRFVILEAADRIGGRAFTDRYSLHRSWDRGCSWFHCADVNPLRPWAERLGVPYASEDRDHLSKSWIGGRWLDERERASAAAALEAAFARVYQGAAEGPDRTVSDLLPSGGGAAPRIRYIARLMASADPEDVSAQGYATYADTGVDLIVTGGLGTLIERMAEGLPVRLNTAVSRVAQLKDGVRVEAAAGTLEARAAIVTVSTNVLTSGRIAFDSGPARALLDLVADLPCGAFEKVALALRRPPPGLGDTQFCWVDPADGSAPASFVMSGGDSPLAVAHFGGSDARALVRLDLRDRVAIVTERLVAAFGSDFRSEIIGAAATDWLSDPLVLGAYSHTRPGLARRREQVIAAETGDIVFAGEAFSLPWHATAHGAYQTGRDAAGRLAARLVA